MQKKKKIFGKKQILIAALCVVLGLAVWLNMEYSAQNGGLTLTTESADKNLGDTKFVNATVENETADQNYFENAKKERQTAREDAVKLIQEALSKTDITEEERATKLEELSATATAVSKEADIDTALAAKNFKKVMAMISGQKCTVIVQVDGELLSSQTLQIQDVVTSIAGIKLEDIKIVTVK